MYITYVHVHVYITNVHSRPQSSASMLSGSAEGALVSPERIRTSAEKSLGRSMGLGWVVKVEEAET